MDEIPSSGWVASYGDVTAALIALEKAGLLAPEEIPAAREVIMKATEPRFVSRHWTITKGADQGGGTRVMSIDGPDTDGPVVVCPIADFEQLAAELQVALNELGRL